MNAQVPAPTREQFKPLKEVQNLGELFKHPQFKERIMQALPQHLKPDWMLSTFIQSVQKVPKLAQCTPLSLAGAFITCASVGMAPNSTLAEVHLIPFDVNKWNSQARKFETVRTDVQVIFGYQGLLNLARRSGMVTSVHCDVVYESDIKTKNFSYEYGTNKHLMHRPTGKHEEGEAPVYAYAWARLKDGDDQFVVMPWADVLMIRNRTQAFKAAMAAYDRAVNDGKKPPAAYTEAPWIKFPVEMAKKSAFRQLAKWLPKSVELANALDMDERQDRETLDFSSVIEGSASVLETGEFTAQEPGDDETQQQEVQTQQQKAPVTPPTTTQTAPKAEPKPRAPRQEKPAQRQPEPPKDEEPPPASEADYGGGSPAIQPVPVDYYLVDENSDLVDNGHTQNAVEFASRFMQLWHKSARPDSLREANADAIADACNDPDAHEILMEAITKPAQAGGVSEVTEQQSAEPANDKDAATAANFMGDIGACADVHALNSLANSMAVKATMARWAREGRNDLVAQVQAAAKSRRDALAAG